VTQQTSPEALLADLPPLVDGDLRLVLERYDPGDPARGWVPECHFRLEHTGTGQPMGQVRLRTALNERLQKFGGHVAYEVDSTCRGHHYAARSIRLIVPLARSLGLVELWITCDPENQASRRTAELAGAVLVDIIPLADWARPLAEPGRTLTCRYRLEL
jgi:tagatose 1,6-diphosphate aldolase